MKKDEFGFFDTATLIKDGKVNLDYYMQNLSHEECIEKCQWWHLDIPKYFNLFCPYCQKTTTYEVAPQIYFEDERVLGMIGVCNQNKIQQQLSIEAKKLILDKNLSVLPLCIP